MGENELWLYAVDQYQAKNREVAEKACLDLINKNAAHAGAWFLRGTLLGARNISDGEIAHYQQALAIAPAWFEPAEALANAYIRTNNFELAQSILARLAGSHSKDVRLHRLAGKLYQKWDRPEQALLALKQATQYMQSNAHDWFALGEYRRTLGAYGAAGDAFAMAYERDKANADAAVNAGACFQMLGNHTTAARWYDVGYGLGARGDYLIQFAEALRQSGEIEGWSALYAQFPPALKMSFSGQRIGLEIAQFEGDFRAVSVSVSSLATALESSAPANSDALDEYAFTRLYADQSPAQHAAFYTKTKTTWDAEISVGTKDREGYFADRPLRIGYLSPDYLDHVMGKMTLPMIENRDQTVQRAILYSTATKEDTLTAQFTSSAESFVRCGAVDDETIAARIRADKIDILIDLSGPTAGSRPGVLARKPAPIIITHIGAAGPIGLSAVDYKLTDSICDLPENQDYLIEKLLPMDGCCYPVPKYPLPTLGLTKSDLRLEGNVIIGAFYTYMKLSERCVLLWKRALDQIPNAVLLFSPLDAKLKIAYENIMRAANISPAQFRFIPAGPTEAERLARYRVVDFVLDSMPYGGVNGTLEALYMGVPVVTLTGKHHSERTSTSMLTHLGVTDTIAQTPEEYIAHAKRLATDSAWRDDISTRIRARWPKFADPVDYARRWEALLRKVAR